MAATWTVDRIGDWDEGGEATGSQAASAGIDAEIEVVTVLVANVDAGIVTVTEVSRFCRISGSVCPGRYETDSGTGLSKADVKS